SRYGVEPRHPWADRRIVEFFLRLPVHQKVREGWTKLLLRRTVAPFLDNEVAWHTGKGHLGIELVRRLMQMSGEQVDAALEFAKSDGGRFVDFVAIAQLARQWKKTKDDDQMYRLFTAVSVLLWVQRVQGQNRLRLNAL
ncbi:asparagine synthase-related protein, partial [Pseudomonadota bacterium]